MRITNGGAALMSSPDGVIDVAKPADTSKPKRPRPDGLTFTLSELAYVVGVSIRQARRMRHKLPPQLPFSRRPLWAQGGDRPMVGRRWEIAEMKCARRGSDPATGEIQQTSQEIPSYGNQARHVNAFDRNRR